MLYTYNTFLQTLCSIKLQNRVSAFEFGLKLNNEYEINVVAVSKLQSLKYKQVLRQLNISGRHNRDVKSHDV